MAENDESELKQESNLLYPELMTQDELIKVLEQRYIKNENLSALCKEGLVELYYTYVLPLPQRKYRLNRRGREMTKKQIVMAKKRKMTEADSSEPPKKKTANEPSSRLLSSFSITTSGDRLKPPPSCIDFSKKKISLNKNKTEQNLVEKLNDTSLDNGDTQQIQKKIVKIKLDSSSNDSPNIIKLNSLSSSISDSKSSVNSVKKIKLISPTSPEKETSFKSTVSLINKHLGGSAESSKKEKKTNTSDLKNKGEGKGMPNKKPKISKISWP